ncbi:type II secretion system protein GspG, partial [Thiotrichales bacterium HSG1]|nr:type II secretion system protein GspG [Thiotrichales bacterium HSG1]
YPYRNPGRGGRDYDLYSFGADGREGGEKEDADIINWKKD